MPLAQLAHGNGPFASAMLSRFINSSIDSTGMDMLMLAVRACDILIIGHKIAKTRVHTQLAASDG